MRLNVLALFIVNSLALRNFKKIHPVLYHEPLFPLAETNDPFHYRSSERKAYKKKMGYTLHVQDHHIIPRQWRKHDLFLKKLKFNINSSKNLYIMPTVSGARHLGLHDDILLHGGGHIAYNKFVKKELDIINKLQTTDEVHYEFWLLMTFLKKNLAYNVDHIPWN
jgi:hypothetical protein